MALPDRGSLVWLHFSPQAGSEQAGRRPGIVLTKTAYHQRSRLAVVCPITSREKGWPMEVKLPRGLAVSGVVLVDHIKSVDREARKMEVVGAAPSETLEEIDARLAPLLSLYSRWADLARASARNRALRRRYLWHVRKHGCSRERRATLTRRSLY